MHIYTLHPPVLCGLQAGIARPTATGESIRTMQFHLQLSDESGGLSAYIKGIVDVAHHGDMDAVFPGLSLDLGLRGIRPVGTCLVGIIPDRPICTCPAGMNLDKTGFNCTGTPGDF